MVKLEKASLRRNKEIYIVSKQWPQKTCINYERNTISFTVEKHRGDNTVPRCSKLTSPVTGHTEKNMASLL